MPHPVTDGVYFGVESFSRSMISPIPERFRVTSALRAWHPSLLETWGFQEGACLNISFGADGASSSTPCIV